ncbi:MAG: NAD-dependent epimerase/dehydratase family protein [bacterium]
MRVLVTGGAGFIGSHVVDLLLKQGHEVSVVDDLSTGREENLNPGAKFYRLDILDARTGEVFERERPECVVHAAAQISVAQSVRDPAGDARVNVVGSLLLMEHARRSGARKVVFSSSGGTVYGEVPGAPAAEDVPFNPQSPYGIGKMCFEYYLEFYRVEYGIAYTVLRYGNVYGPRQDPHGEAGVVAIFAMKTLRGETPTINGDGKYFRDYVYVSDVAHSNRLCLERGDNRIYNIGTQTATDVNEVFRLIAEAAGFTGAAKHGPPRHGDLRRSVLDVSRARRELGWAPVVPLDEGIAKTVEFFRTKLRA